MSAPDEEFKQEIQRDKDGNEIILWSKVELTQTIEDDLDIALKLVIFIYDIDKALEDIDKALERDIDTVRQEQLTTHRSIVRKFYEEIKEPPLNTDDKEIDEDRIKLSFLRFIEESRTRLF